MTFSFRWGAAVGVAAALLGPAAARAQACDRGCLAGIADAYIAAVVKHDPKAAPFAPGVKFTENTATIPLGEGLWRGASEGPSGFKITAADPAGGQVGLFMVMKENGKPAIVIVRLRVAGGRITEVEQFVQRDLRNPSAPGLAAPRPALVANVPSGERSTRDQMAKIAASYFESIEHDNGDLAPFAADCDRHESGEPFTLVPIANPPGTPMQQVLAMGCHDQVSSNVLAHINRVWPRGPMIFDEEKGLIMTFPVFIHRGDIQSVTLRGVAGSPTVTTPTPPGDTYGGEILKIRGGQIHEVEVAGVNLPYGTQTGWNKAPQPGAQDEVR